MTDSQFFLSNSGLACFCSLCGLFEWSFLFKSCAVAHMEDPNEPRRVPGSDPSAGALTPGPLWKGRRWIMPQRRRSAPRGGHEPGHICSVPNEYHRGRRLKCGAVINSSLLLQETVWLLVICLQKCRLRVWRPSVHISLRWSQSF